MRWLVKSFLNNIRKIFYKVKYKDGYKITRILMFKYKQYVGNEALENIIDYPNETNKIIICKTNGKKVINPKTIDGLKIKLLGSNNIIEIFEPCTFSENEIFIYGNNCHLTLNKCTLFSVKMKMQHSAYCFIDEKSSVGGYIHLANEANLSLKIGKNCMFSLETAIWGTDGHIIKDLDTNECINRCKNGIIIGDNCWLGYRSVILKNARIAPNTVVGANSVVKNSFFEQNTIIAGIPAKIIKRNVQWYTDPLD